MTVESAKSFLFNIRHQTKFLETGTFQSIPFQKCNASFLAKFDKLKCQFFETLQVILVGNSNVALITRLAQSILKKKKK